VDLAAVPFLGTQAPVDDPQQPVHGRACDDTAGVHIGQRAADEQRPGRVDGGHGGVLPAIGAAVVLVGHLLLSVAVEAVMGQDHAPGAARATVSVADAATH
jgi:hypothetical protein